VDDMMEAMEQLLFQHGVDVVFSGHVHAYERAFRTYRWVAAIQRSGACTHELRAQAVSLLSGRQHDLPVYDKEA
jgi:hypothetical protein